MTAATIATALATAAPSPCRVSARTIASRYCIALPVQSFSQSPLQPSPRNMRRTFSSSSSSGHQNQTSNSSPTYYNNPPNAIPVPPPPSWSVNELRLTSSTGADNEDDDKISEEELATLARRCLIDVRRLTPERRDRLRTHVAGIVRCASVLLDAKNLDDDVDGNSNNINNDSDDSDGILQHGKLTDAEVYDAPRGLKKIPVRRERTNSDHEDDWTLRDSGESKAVMQSKSVQSKMVETHTGEKFFSVVTKR